MNDAGASERPFRFIGKPLPRKEDERLITGKGRFTDDFNLDGQAYAAMVRSPHPHARITAIDATAAKLLAVERRTRGCKAQRVPKPLLLRRLQYGGWQCAEPPCNAFGTCAHR